MTSYWLSHFKQMVSVWKTKSLLFCLRDDLLIVFRNENHVTVIFFIKMMSHDFLVQVAYYNFKQSFWISCHLACSRLSVVGDERKWARKTNEGGLRRRAAGEPVRISLRTLFWCSRSCYTLWLVNFDSTVNTPAVASYLVNQKDRERGLHERLRGIWIDFHLGRLSAGIPEYSSAKEGAATTSSKSRSWERHFRYSSNRFWEKFNFSALPTTC